MATINNAIMARAVREKVEPKFRGRETLHSKAKGNYPLNVEREYLRLTNAYTALIFRALQKHLPTIRRAITEERQGFRHDADSDIRALIARVFSQIHMELSDSTEIFGLERRLNQIADLERKMSVREFKRAVRQTLGINLADDYYMGEFLRGNLDIWTSRNTNLIKSIPQRTLGDMRDIITEGYTAGRTNNSIARDIQERYGVERSRAQFIARDQVSKLNAELTQVQQRDAGIREYVWESACDSRVRADHARLNKKTFSWNDPPVIDSRTGRRGHPGEDFQCRCIALPKFNLPGLSLPWEGKE